MSRQKTGQRLNATDFYATPPWCYENLDIDWKMFASAHEPCRGDGRIQFFLEEEQRIPCSYSEIMEDKDFFDWSTPVDLILTNPPFSLAKEFIEHSVVIAPTVLMLLRINYLGSIGRHKWWKQYTPTALRQKTYLYRGPVIVFRLSGLEVVQLRKCREVNEHL